MKGTMAHALAEIDRLDMPGVAGSAVKRTGLDQWAIKRGVYTESQWLGEVSFYEPPGPDDGPDCLFVAIVAVKDGALIRLPITRVVGASLVNEIVRKLAA